MFEDQDEAQNQSIMLLTPALTDKLLACCSNTMLSALTLQDGNRYLSAVETEIKGVLHRAPGTRTLDYLNRQAEAFVAMTEATLKRSDNSEYVPFIALNKIHILRVIEDIDAD